MTNSYMMNMGGFGIKNNRFSDPYYDNVKLLLRFNEAGGSQSFVDEKSHTITAVGNATHSEQIKKWGRSSGVFDGSGDRITIPDSTDFDLGSSNFTIETWFWLIATKPANAQAIITKRSSSAVRGPFALLVPTNTSKIQALLANVDTSYAVNITSTNSLTLSTWNHIALVRSSSDVYLFINGALEAQTTISGSLLVNAAGLALGGDIAGTDTSLNGRMDDFRITGGITAAARYTSAFNPPPMQFPNFAYP